MGNCGSSAWRTSKSTPTALPTLEDRIKLFKEATNTWDIDALIQGIDQLLKYKLNPASPSTQNTSSGSTDLIPSWTAATNSGVTFLKFVNEHTQKIGAKGDFFRSGQGNKVVQEILQQLGQLHWIVGGLSIIAYLLNKVDKMTENKSECLQLLKCMFDLANHIKNLNVQMPGEEVKLRDAFALIVEGCMTCASQIHSGKFFSFLKASVDSQALKNLSSKIDRLYRDLTLATVADIQKHQPSYLPPLLPKYPREAVGLQKPLEVLKEMLDLQTTELSSRVVVIYGFGGVGKTTLANAVVATLANDLKDYKYTKLEMNEDPFQNDLKGMQQQILADCFPTYQNGRRLLVRNCEDGRNHIAQAFNCQTNIPAFIYIDNAQRSKDLKDLLPENLRGLSRSRILVTTRHLAVTHLFQDSGIPCHHYAVTTLPKDDALKILCNDPTHLNQITDHVDRITRIAGGIPLVLKILGAHLRKLKYNVEKCSILKALEEGEDVKEEGLSERLVYFVFNELETSTQEAFLDICSFFKGWSRRYVEYIVGAEEVASLADAALVTSIPFVDLTDLWKERISLIGEDKLIMHDVIQAKGRNMGQSTRMKDLESLYRAARDQIRIIKGVELHTNRHLVIKKSDLSFISDSLRTLILGDRINDRISLSGRSSPGFKELRCLRIGPSIPLFPMNLDELACLSFYEGPIFKEVLSKLPQNLKCLFAVQMYSYMEESVSIHAVTNSSLEALELSDVENMRVMFDGRLRFDALKILLLSGWKRMRGLPPQVCDLPCLNKLILRECWSLKRVPEAIANLRALTHLDLRRCHELEEVCLGELTALQYLDLGECWSLVKLPDSFGQLSTLEYLCLYECKRLQELPGNFAQLRSLKLLDLSRCRDLKELPSNFIQLPSLKVIWMYGVDRLLRPLSPIDISWKIVY